MRHVAWWMSALAVMSITATAAALAPGARAPEIGAIDLSGDRVTVAGLRGHVAVIDFWATWCGPCAHEMPALQTFYDAMRADGLIVVGVTSDASRSNVDTFVARHHLTFPIVQDPAGGIARRYAPPTQPTSYFVGRDGIVRHVHEGFAARDVPTMERELRALLAEH
jgi:peroxiredoxin